MPSHAQLAARLLRDAAQFFKTIGEQNPQLKTQMDENANVFDQVAALVEQDPNGVIEEQGQPPSPNHAQLAGRLLVDASQFFRTIGEQNPQLQPQMDENANVFEQVATLVEQNPNGVIEEGTPPASA